MVFATTVAAQDASPAQPAPTPTPQTGTQTQQANTEAKQAEAASKTMREGATPVGESVAAKAAAEPVYREYKGIQIGMSAENVRAKFGKPVEKSDAMDFYVFSERERARIYYQDGKVSAIISTYLGRDSGAPTPVAVIGTDIEAKPDGSLYQMKTYPQAGYWVAYSRTAGDSPMVIITMQKSR
ncbi:MAG TPA: hypothetical protein VGW12_19100 [Pyrinomonadaceae bacterium]|nr:hypothetical protein [Pyrinomonadaceae bacterium]